MEPKKDNTRLYVILGFIFLLVVIVIMFVYIRNSNTDVKTEKAKEEQKSLETKRDTLTTIRDKEQDSISLKSKESVKKAIEIIKPIKKIKDETPQVYNASYDSMVRSLNEYRPKSR